MTSKKPKAGNLFNSLRQCDISGLFNDDDQSVESSTPTGAPSTTAPGDDSYFYKAAKANTQSPPIKKDQVPQRDLLPVFTNSVAQKNGDLSILDIISEIDEPLRVKQ